MHEQPSGEKDPVCGMTVDPEKALSFEYQRKVYYFCAERCRARFQKSPEDFLEKSKPAPPIFAPQVVYTCPMHPNVRNVGPGSCPLCGMALEPLDISATETGNPELED